MSDTPMEKIKAYFGMKPFVTKEQLDEIAQFLNLSETDRSKRLEGKDGEYEFILRCYLLENIDKIIAFEEAFSRLTQTTTVDFLFLTKQGERIAVEVKCTEKDDYKVTEKLLSEKEEFARLMGAELYFAIRIKNYWLFLSSKYIRQRNRKIGIKDLVNSDFKILGEKMILFNDPITIKSMYTRDPNKSIDIENFSYGFLERYTLKVGNKEILKITRNNHKKYIFYAMALQALQDIASVNSQVVTDLGDGRTLVVEELEANRALSISDFLITSINHTSHKLHQLYDPTVYVTEIVDAKGKMFISQAHLISVLLELEEKGMNIAATHNTEYFPLHKLYAFS